MKNNVCNLFLRMAPAAILLLTPALASADAIILLPSSPTVAVGDVFQLNLFAASLPLGAYDVTFSYNPLLASIDPSLVNFDIHLGAPDNSFQSVIPTLDTLELAEVSFLTSAADLAALQSDPTYRLAVIPVKALQPGIVSFDFVSTPFTAASDYTGALLDGVSYQGASVTIQEVTSEPPPPPPAADAPESGSALLLFSGLALLAAARLLRQASPGHSGAAAEPVPEVDARRLS